MYEFLANLTLVIHLIFILFVVFGGLFFFQCYLSEFNQIKKFLGKKLRGWIRELQKIQKLEKEAQSLFTLQKIIKVH